MNTLAAIWSDLDNNLFINKKPKEEKSVNIHVCKECNGTKIFGPDRLPVCSECGLIDDSFIDDSPEWTSGLTDDGRVNDPSRCGTPNANPELFSDSWGKGTIISTYRSSNYETKRMAKISFHMSMNHKDRSLYHAYQDIEEACSQTIPDSILKDAKIMYRRFNCEKLTRGAIRLGIKANCVLYACRLANVSRTTKEIADLFGIQSKDISRTTQIFKDTIMGKTEKNYVTRPYDVMPRLLGSFEYTREERYKCNQICETLKDCVDLMSKTPNSIASAIILVVLGKKYSKSTICEKCSVSVPTLNKIETIIKKHLEFKGFNT